MYNNCKIIIATSITLHWLSIKWFFINQSITAYILESAQLSSVTQSCLILCDPMHCCTPGLPVHHQLPEFTQTHVHWVSDAIQLSHLLSWPSPPALSLSRASGSFPVSWLFTSGGQSIGVSASASVLPMNTQDWFPLGWTGWIFLQSKDSQESSPTPQFISINSSVLNFLYRSWVWPQLITSARPDFQNKVTF